MYRIIGADGKEYGPISSEQLRQWIAEGRANAQTRVLAEGTTEWKPLADFLEFAGALGAKTPVFGATLPPLQARVAVPGRGDALAQVSGPALGLIIVAILNFVGAAMGFLMNIMGATFIHS